MRDNSHEAIIDKETWKAVQRKYSERAEKKEKGIVAGDHHPLYGKVFCGECGAPYVRRTLKNSDGTYYKAWNCKERQKGKKGNGCKNRIVREDELEAYVEKERILVTLDGIGE